MTDLCKSILLVFPFLFKFAAKPKHALVFNLIFELLGATFGDIEGMNMVWIWKALLSLFVDYWLNHDQLSLFIFVQVFTAALLILFAHTRSTTSELIL